MPDVTPDALPPARVVEIATPQGAARAHVRAPAAPAPGALVLGHGAGGGVDAPDLRAVTAAALGLGLAVALVEQPYRVAGRRVGPRGPALDEAWAAVVADLRAGGLDVPLVTGGRSAGARTACRTALATGATGVLCLAFPTRPPGRPDAPDRLPELDGAGVPVLVVQGATDPYGTPPEAPGRTVVRVAGDHGLKKDLPAVAAAVAAWLPGVLPLG
ncbi:alpha/beta hydrolase [Cellulomonas hominis]|uniref:Alpha/beta hydrolase n=1 Tax=Cellulomonas hominis TaxID=156981 RepID=A0A511FGD0_9CELL|nr:alpha/beta hydrolase [Cellulomonas hominis]